ncbi:MAG: trigger factor [Bacteroidales bacterium]|nr:trigger factor [Candidatus Minthousia equi]MDO4956302.1 trigger factor [Bacteroidales bacterium]
MNISLENTGKVSAELIVKVEAADYQAEVEKSLKNFRRNANVPGFRKGMVPMGLIKKQYGAAAKAEEVNKLLQNKMFEYIKENNVNMLGEPLTSEKQEMVDFATADDFTFIFDIALAPQFEVEVSAKDKVPYYTIDVTEDLVEQQCKMYQQRAGEYKKVDSYQDRDMLKGLLAELDENGSTLEGGLQVEDAVMLPSYFKNDDQKAIFADAKVNDVLVFNPNTAYAGNEVELSSFMKIKKEEVAQHAGNFSFQVNEITRYEESELNQAIFDQVFGEGNVTSVEEFKQKIKEQMAQNFVADSDYKFLVDVRDYLKNKVGKLEYPDALLKKIMLLNNKEKGEEFVNENYDKSIEELTWHLIKEQLVKANGVKVENNEVTEMAKQATRAQFAQYGMMNIPDEMLENYAKEMLKKEDTVENLVNRVIEGKLAAALKSQVKLDNKTVTLEEFNKMFA